MRDRDAWEFGLLDAADRIALPTLGICRGMQVMAVRAGGTLEQYLPDVVGHDEHAPGGNSFGWTSIATREGSRVRTFVGDRVQVSCHHHQSVLTHPGFEATARAADGTIEAMRIQNGHSGLVCSGIPRVATTMGCSSGLLRPHQEWIHGPDMWPELVEGSSTGSGRIHRVEARNGCFRATRPDAAQDRRRRKSGLDQAVFPSSRSGQSPDRAPTPRPSHDRADHARHPSRMANPDA